jgi:hypothetical protein
MIDLLVIIFVLCVGGAITVAVICLTANAIAITQDSWIQFSRLPLCDSNPYQRLQMWVTILKKSIVRHKSGQ